MGNSTSESSGKGPVLEHDASPANSPVCDPPDVCFVRTYDNLLEKQSNDLKTMDLVCSSYVLALFPTDLMSVGTQFLVNIINGYSESSASSRNTINVVGDSADVTNYQSISQVQKQNYTRCSIGSGENNTLGAIYINRTQFTSACKTLLHLKSMGQKNDYFVKLCNNYKTTVLKTQLQKLLYTCIDASAAQDQHKRCLESLDKRIVNTLVDNIIGNKEELTVDDITEWTSRTKLDVFKSVHDFLLYRLQNIQVDDTGSELSSDSQGLCCAIRWLLCHTLSPAYLTDTQNLLLPSTCQKLRLLNGFELLYDSTRDGLSINRFEHHVLSYRVPSVLLIVTESPIFYVTSSSEWRKSMGKFGGSESSFVQLIPIFHRIDDTDLLTWIDRPRDPNRGICIKPSSSNHVVVFIPHDFTHVRIHGVKYSIMTIQLFGCGDEVARLEQLKQKEWENRQVQKSQQQKLHFEPNWQENADKHILELAGIKTEHAQR